jgi:kelch-like protein 10
MALFTTVLHSEEETEVFLPGVTSETMSSVLDYAYIRFVDINEKNVCQLLVSADYLSVLGLLELCCDFLRSEFAPENCIYIMRFARDYFCSSLERDARSFVMSNFVQVSQKSDELLELPPQELQAMIGADELNVKCEEVVWEAVLRWINHDTQNRRGNIVDLMKKVRLGLLDTRFFLENVKNHPYVMENNECYAIITDMIKLRYNSKVLTLKSMEILLRNYARARTPHEIIFAIGGWMGENATNYIETYDTRADRWVEVEEVDPAGPRAFHGTAVIGFNIYVIGGTDGIVSLNSCRCFNAVAKTWREVAPMLKHRCYLSVAVLGELVYALGGHDGLQRRNTAERYNYHTNQWSMIAPMNVRRCNASATALNGKIYIIGGFNGEDHMNSSEVYDPEVNQWTLIAEMQFGRSGLSCIAYHDCVYAIGGYNGVSFLCNGERYNPTANSWTQIRDMYKPRSNFGIEVIDDMIFAIGGIHDNTPLCEVECYDEKSNEWFKAMDMNIHAAGLSACVVVALPNVHDYIHKNRDLFKEKWRQKLLAQEGERN